MNKTLQRSAHRKKVGKILMLLRKHMAQQSRWKFAQQASFSYNQVKDMEDGSKSYTIDSLLIYLDQTGYDVGASLDQMLQQMKKDAPDQEGGSHES